MSDEERETLSVDIEVMLQRELRKLNVKLRGDMLNLIESAAITLASKAEWKVVAQ
jgi:hypothetical protein